MLGWSNGFFIGAQYIQSFLQNQGLLKAVGPSLSSVVEECRR